ncbi:hypothetical protein [Erythrobacter sp.]|uniref:hypothetical protein n=1 Tax=Erythrobacter sp. TaxID=1042 RepID=UPI001425D390|nr:hypothetical protein [Erythrobacter sp.]QIQ86392.1 MAG: hypothetical protein G9473_06610 [Erythrobacter sp.]
MAATSSSGDETLAAPSSGAGIEGADDAAPRQDRGSVETAPPKGDKDLTFIVSPYVWIPTVTGNIGTSAQGLDFALDAGDLLDVFEFGGLIHGEARHKSGWGISTDYIFANLGAGVDIVIGDVDADIDAEVLELTLVRRIDAGSDAIDLYAGIRRWDADVAIAIETFFFDDTIVTGDEWTDPIVGARYQHEFARDWRLLVQGDIGGFGAGSEFSWNAVAGVSHSLSDKASLQLVYKTLSVDRQSPAIGNGPPIDLDITITGPLIGFAYRF